LNVAPSPATITFAIKAYVTVMCRARNIAALQERERITGGERRQSVLSPVVGQREHNRQRDEDAMTFS
jgi:hypothetical protein